MKRPKAPYKVLFSNDTTNITTCTSPYHQKGEVFRPQMLKETVYEVAKTGVDAHLIQLAHGAVPWYQSIIYPIAEHHAWWKERFGVDPIQDAFGVGAVHEYLLNGGDLLQDFIDACRETGQAPFVSLRLNDAHHVENVNTFGNTRGVHAISRFYADHPEYRLGQDLNDWNQRNLNWIFPEVREYMFSLIKEQCENYDIDGFELDFQRIPSFFQIERTTVEQRTGIMTAFASRVRDLLEKTTRPGTFRWLCIRIPCFLALHERIGIDLPSLAKAGVDMVNVSPFYFTDQQTDFAKIRAAVPQQSVYLEMCHDAMNGKATSTNEKYDNKTFRRVTSEQYTTTAHMAYARGGSGVSFFNFVYYREHGTPGRGPFNEPPFSVLDHMADPEWLAKQPQHYFIAHGWNALGTAIRQMPRDMSAGDTAVFTLDAAPGQEGWRQTGQMRIQSEEPMESARFEASLNGRNMEATEDVSEPYGNLYTPLLGTTQTLRSWTVPAFLLKDGINEIRITMQTGQPVKLIFLDLSIR